MDKPKPPKTSKYGDEDSLNGQEPEYSVPWRGGNAVAGQNTDNQQPYKDPLGETKMDQPKSYESAGDYGSGFVNLSHLLGLNYASGRQSAADLAKKVGNYGMDARNSIGDASNKFNADAKSGMTDWRDWVSDDISKAPPVPSDVVNKAAGGYTGPTDLGQQSGYADLAKKVGRASDMATNAALGGYGIAADVGHGLSPAQANASAFYMGVNNKAIKNAGRSFQNLRDTLDKANADALGVAQQAKHTTDESVGVLSDYGKKQKDYWDTIDKNAAGQKGFLARQANVNNAAQNDASNQSTREKAASEHRTPEVTSLDDMDWAISQGMPGHMAHNGMTWDEWVAAGRPGEDSDWYKKWLSDHGYPPPGDDPNAYKE